MKPTKNIMLLHSSSDIYGASKVLLITAQILFNQYKVYVVLSEEGPLADVLRIHKIETIICKLGILRRKYFSAAGLINRLKVLFSARRKLLKIIKEKHIDIIYSNTSGVLIGGFLANECRLKHIWHIHEIIIKPKIFSKVIGMLINRYSTKVIVVSNEVRKHWLRYINGDKLLTIYNGLDYTSYLDPRSTIRQELGVLPDQVLLGMIGRVNQWKGQKYFLEIASILIEKISSLRFLLAGDPFPGYRYLEDELTQFIIDHRLEKVVSNLGFRSDVSNVLNGLDIFILPSILPDPLPTVVLEAMACAKPVVATKHGGALEMVDEGHTGLLIPWNNAREAADQIYSLIKDKNKRHKYGDTGRNRVLNLFSMERYQESLLKVVDSL